MPRRALRPCSKAGCPGLTRERYCDDHRNEGWRQHQKGRSASARGYGATWRRLRLLVLARDNYLCQQCRKRGRTTPATDVDHRTPKDEGGTDDMDNLWSLCGACHRGKTAEEANRKRR